MNSSTPLEQSFCTEDLQNAFVVVGFSGGADSAALLHRLFSLREELSLSLKAVHIHHGIRGEEADRDLRFAESFCREFGISFAAHFVDVPALSKERGISEEACGRMERYRIFKEEAGEQGLILTAHTASDNVETVLLNLLRGTGLKGLTGIPYERDNIRRPLLHCTRAQVEEYCHRMGLSFVEDSSNFTLDYTRNRLRLEILPKLKELNPSFDRTLLHTAELLRQDEDFLSAEAEKLYAAAKKGDGLSGEVLSSAHPAVLGRAALLFLKEHGLPQNRNTVESICQVSHNGGKKELAFGVFLRRYRGILRLEREETAPKFTVVFPTEEKFPFSVTLPEDYYGGERLCFSLTDRENGEKVYKKLFFFSIDYDTISGKLYLRQKRPGDKLSLPHGEGHKTLKKLFSEKGLSALERETRLVLADEKGVLWVEGFGPDARSKITDNTRRVLTCIREEERGTKDEKI